MNVSSRFLPVLFSSQGVARATRGARRWSGIRSGVPVALLLAGLAACDGPLVGRADSDLTPPTVSSTLPAAGAGAVPFNAPVLAVFSEDMQASTLTTTSFVVMRGEEILPGSVNYVGLTAIFTPRFALTPDTEYVATVADTVKDLAGNFMVDPRTWTFTTAAFPDLTSPQVSSTVPTSGATNVAANADISVVFSEPMDPLTVTTTTVQLFQGETSRPGAVEVVGATATLSPATDLAFETEYTVIVNQAAADAAGNTLAQNYQWSFTTGAQPDTTPPVVSSTTPETSSVDVTLNATISVRFSEAMDPGTVSTAHFRVLAGANAVDGAVTYTGLTASFDPLIQLAPESIYTVLLDTGLEDLAGNALANEYTWTFTTGRAADTTAPQVVLTFPLSDATDVAPNLPVTITFNEGMDPLTLTGANLTLQRGTAFVPGVVTFTETTATFTPDDDLADTASYLVRVDNLIADLSGNRLAADYVFDFQTGSVPDTTRPEILTRTPEPGATTVALNGAVSVTFSESIAPPSVTTATVSLRNGSLVVASTVSVTNSVVILSPALPLLPFTEYEATVDASVSDLAGNTLGSDATWTFTTGPLPDTTRPQVTFTIPGDDSEATSTETSIVAAFTEAMEPSTINITTFTVQQLETVVPGTVTFVGVAARFRPTVPLDPLTNYSATISGNVRDLAGNNMGLSYVWNFRTGVGADVIRPYVIRRFPADLSSGVSTRTGLTLTFSEEIDPATVDTTTFTLVDSTLVPVGGAVSVLGQYVTFSPTDLLDPNEVFTASITTATADLAGNRLFVRNTWSFTTGATADTTAPDVVLTNPANSDVLVFRDASVNVTFSEAMDTRSITSASLILTGPGDSDVRATVRYHEQERIATSTPTTALLPFTSYTATLFVAVRDLAGNPIVATQTWRFSTGGAFRDQPGVSLGILGSFAVTSGQGLVVLSTSGPVVLNGNIALDPDATCLADGVACTSTNPDINGARFINDVPGVSSRAQDDVAVAFTDAISRPADTTLSDLSGTVLLPGVYVSAIGMSTATSSVVTFDGRGDATATWIMRAGPSLTIANTTRFELIGGARARNIVWVIDGPVVMGSSLDFHGTVLADGDITLGAGSSVVGRLLTATGGVSLTSNTVTLPTR